MIRNFHIQLLAALLMILCIGSGCVVYSFTIESEVQLVLETEGETESESENKNKNEKEEKFYEYASLDNHAEELEIKEELKPTFDQAYSSPYLSIPEVPPELLLL